MSSIASAFTIDDIYVYIFSWKHVTTNARMLFTRVTEHFPHTFFINCDEHVSPTDLDISPIDKIIQLDDSYYYGGQFHTAINHIPTGKILACIVGDVSPDADWHQIAMNTVYSFNIEPIGVYAPNVDYTFWTMRGKHISNQLYEVPNTDCTCWFLHPKLVDSLRPLNYFEVANLGWGIDKIFIIEAYLHKLYVARDYAVLVCQPKGTNYNKETAQIQMRNLMLAYKELTDRRRRLFCGQTQ